MLDTVLGTTEEKQHLAALGYGLLAACPHMLERVGVDGHVGMSVCVRAGGAGQPLSPSGD